MGKIWMTNLLATEKWRNLMCERGATGSKRLFAWLLWDFNESFQVEEEWKKKMIPLHVQKDEADEMQMTAWRLESSVLLCFASITSYRPIDIVDTVSAPLSSPEGSRNFVGCLVFLYDRIQSSCNFIHIVKPWHFDIWDNSLHASWTRRSWSWKGICWSRRLSWGHGSPATPAQIRFCLAFLSDPVQFWQESPQACRFTFRRSREGTKWQNVLDPQSTLCFLAARHVPAGIPTCSIIFF